ncbi:MAG: putative metallopeptidase [Bacteroidota bacterium]
MKNWKNFALFCTVIVMVACNNDENVLDVETEVAVEGYPLVEEALWPYFERFENAARERGFVIDLNAARVTGEIDVIDDDGVAGQCTYRSHAPNSVLIDQEFWDVASDLAKEYVVFHELGHCQLGREHREDAHANGTCVSMMRSGLGNCRDNYSRFTRVSYLNELFDSSYWDKLGQPQ